jgi:chemotaxis protein histidine kinase CheA
MTEDKIVKIIDKDVHTRGVSVEQVGEQGALIVKSVESVPTDSSKVNGSLVLGYTDGNLTTVTKTIGEDSYVKTLTYTEGVLTSISAWVVT